MADKTIYDLKLHETTYTDVERRIHVLRVDPGWIYTVRQGGEYSSVFVPDHNMMSGEKPSLEEVVTAKKKEDHNDFFFAPHKPVVPELSDEE